LAITFSIIIPVYNDATDLKLVLEAIDKQNYPAENFETFVVDNGSSDNSVEVAKSYPFVDVLLEHKNLNSPYSCRNRGIERAKGDIIVLLDASCKPVKNWLLSAQQCFEETDADILGGDVKFDFKDNMTTSKYYDSLKNIRMRESIKKKNIGKTANLFLKRKAFDEVGKFEEGLRSGGDVRWTQKASNLGYKLVFCENAIVYKTARNFKELVKKQWRVGIHQPYIYIENGKSYDLGKKLLHMFIPASPRGLFKTYKNSDENIKRDISVFRLYFVNHFIKVVMTLAFITGILKMKLYK